MTWEPPAAIVTRWTERTEELAAEFLVAKEAAFNVAEAAVGDAAYDLAKEAFVNLFRDQRAPVAKLALEVLASEGPVRPELVDWIKAAVDRHFRAIGNSAGHSAAPFHRQGKTNPQSAIAVVDNFTSIALLEAVAIARDIDLAVNRAVADAALAPSPRQARGESTTTEERHTTKTTADVLERQKAAISTLLRELQAIREAFEAEPWSVPWAAYVRWRIRARRDLERLLGADELERFDEIAPTADGYLTDTAIQSALSGLVSHLHALGKDLEAHPEHYAPSQREEPSVVADPRQVAVVVGRNADANEAIFEFLTALDLKPFVWDDAIRNTGKGTPHAREVLESLFSTRAQAVVVVFTGDEAVSLLPALRSDDARDRGIRRQARANVWFEAGIALALHPERTILVKIGRHEEPSDIHGLQYIYYDGKEKARNRLRVRLEDAKCQVSDTTDRWLTAGRERVETVLRNEKLELNDGSDGFEVMPSGSSAEPRATKGLVRDGSLPFYFSSGEDAPYCPRCWEVDQRPVHLDDAWDRRRWECPQCHYTKVLDKAPPVRQL